MKIIVYKNYNQICDLIAKNIVNKINNKNKSVLGLATGDTFIGVYKRLIYYYNSSKVNFNNVITINLDEYIGELKFENTYKYFMYENFFKHVNIKKKNTYIPENMSNISKSVNNFQQIIKNHIIDIQLLGIGFNGHIGFNEPNNQLHANTHVANLNKSTIKDNSRFFEKGSQIPTKAITMGMADIFNAKEIIVVCNNIKKINIIRKLLENDLIDTKYPVSLLKIHNNVNLYILYELYDKIKDNIYNNVIIL
ncbi:MAG: glucosamine-6-phosphate deaminase [Bacteroides sp.]|nr:MAG: glucosamine-6-phosphate deaminase [Bacteroides sp.]